MRHANSQKLCMYRTVFALFIITFLLESGALSPVHAQIPANIQSVMFVKILSYEELLIKKFDSTVTIGILYDLSNAASQKSKDEMQENIEKLSQSKKLQGKTINTVAIAFQESARQTVTSIGGQLFAAYLCPGLDPHIESLVEEFHKRNILTLTAEESYMKKSVAVGLGLRGKSPEILINIDSSKDAGADFSVNLLKLATVINN